jgi:hypothetical protein
MSTWHMNVRVVRIFRVPEYDIRITQIKFWFITSCYPKFSNEIWVSVISSPVSDILGSGHGFFAQCYAQGQRHDKYLPNEHFTSI